MDIFEITGNTTGLDRSGVTFLNPADSYQNLENGFIYRQVLQSRQGFDYFAPRLANQTRVFGIFEHILPDGTKELLVADKNFLYKYNPVTGVFDQIPFGGSMAAYTGFNVTAKDFYISGTSYPTSANLPRFVFTGEGITANAAGSSVFFYNGTDVRDYTAIADNANYIAPALGALNKAIFVVRFNERLNFISPTIGGVNYTQGVLYSGIRTVSGNGDNFNVAGSGLFQADTYQAIWGFSILGQVLVLNFQQMNYTLEKTRDAFNPYFGRAVSGKDGTDAKFSSVVYDDTDKSLGKSGVISTDGRRTLRADNKIPRFTADDIDQVDFNLTYGGFDRANNQFLWSYKKSESNSLTQNSVLVYNYEELTWAVYDQRFSVIGQSDVGINLTWDQIDEALGNESWATWDTTEELWDQIGLGKSVLKTLAGDDLGFIYQLNMDFDDYFSDIQSITNAASAVIGITQTGILAGDLVIIENVVGMVTPNGDSINSDTPYTVLAATPTSITINFESSNSTAYISGGSVSKVISFKAETIPFNPYRDKGFRIYISHVEFLLESNGGHLRVDVVADEEEAPFIKDVLIQPSNTSTKSKQWITMTVNEEANFLTFIMKQQSVSSQVRLTSMRVHCQQGGMTSG